MSQSTPPNWPQQQPGQPNPFSDQGQSPFVPGYAPQYPPQTPIEDVPGMRWVLPVGTSAWAIAAGYLGLFSLICFPAPLALLCGIIAIWHLRRNPRLSGWGRAIFATVMGALGMIGLAIMIYSIAASQ